MSLLGFLQIGCLIVFGLLLLVAAWQDVRTLHIADGSVQNLSHFGRWLRSG